MSHTFESESGRTVIHYDSDLSGDVEISRKYPDGLHVSGVDLPMKDLLDFMAECIRSERIAQLEQASTEDILGLNKPLT